MTRYDIILGKSPPEIVTVSEPTIMRSSFLDLKNWAFAVGTGGLNSLTSPDEKPSKLLNEIARKKFTSENIEYVTSEGIPSIIPTRTVDFIWTLTETEAIGLLNEIGLFDDLGNLICYKTFSGINKTDSVTLSLHYRIQF
jgi:hypothetical protein